MNTMLVDRISSLRAIGADAGTLGYGRAMSPVAAVHTAEKIAEKAAEKVAAVPAPSAIVNIGQINKAAHAGIVYTNMSDPSLRSSGAELAPYDWSLNPTRTQKVEEKPPLTKMLIDQLESLRLASAAAVQAHVPVDEKSRLKAEKAPVTDLAGSQSLSQQYMTREVKKTSNTLAPKLDPTIL
jgi:hypothetical protein